jgi:hypothetical protein
LWASPSHSVFSRAPAKPVGSQLRFSSILATITLDPDLKMWGLDFTFYLKVAFDCGGHGFRGRGYAKFSGADA